MCGCVGGWEGGEAVSGGLGPGLLLVLQQVNTLEGLESQEGMGKGVAANDDD